MSKDKGLDNIHREPLVSIVIPTYNTREDFLYKLINSIDRQNYSNIEVIIVDDASTDSGHIDRLKKLQKEKKDYPLNIIFNKKNTGPSGAMNTGVHHSRGKYIKNCGHDDYFPEDAFFNSVKYMEEHNNIDVVFSDIEVFGSYDGIWSGIYGYGTSVKKDLSNLTFEKLFTEEVMLIGPCCLMTKRLFDRIGNFDPDIGTEDWDLFLRALDHGIKFHYLEEVTYHRRKYEESLATNALYIVLSRYNVVKKYQNRLELRDEIYKRYISILEQLMSLSKKEFWYIFTSIARDKELGYMYLPKLFLKYPSFFPHLVFRAVFPQNSYLFRELKSRFRN